MINVQQTEFWADSVAAAASRRAGREGRGAGRMEAGSAIGRFSPGAGAPEEETEAMEERRPEEPEVLFPAALEVSIPVESLGEEDSELEEASGVPVGEEPDPLDVLTESAATEGGQVAAGRASEDPVVPTRPRNGSSPVALFFRGPAGPRSCMARFLRLTGSLDSLEEEGRWYDVPRQAIRPPLILDVKRRISRDFLKDLRMPPRSYFINQYQRPRGWLKV